MDTELLKQRVREELVFHDRTLQEHRWRRLGLAQASGLAEQDFFQVVRTVDRELDRASAAFLSLKQRITRYAVEDRKELTSAHLNELIREAAKLQLSPEFVTGRWLPELIGNVRLPAEPAATGRRPGGSDGILPEDEKLTESDTPLFPGKEEPVIVPPGAGGKRSYVQTGVAVLLAALLFSGTVLLLRKRPEAAQAPVLQGEMEKLIREGVGLVAEKGDHAEANIRFSQAWKLSAGQDVRSDSLLKYAGLFEKQGDDLCSGTTNAAVRDIANEYYRHAAILLHRNPSVCP